MTATTDWIRERIKADDLHAFYTCSEWLHLRAEVLAADKHECQVCKSKGKYKRAELVHHVNHVRQHPELALSKYYTIGQKKRRNLISVCKDCHETVCHPERMCNEWKEPLTEERW